MAVKQFSKKRICRGLGHCGRSPKVPFFTHYEDHGLVPKPLSGNIPACQRGYLINWRHASLATAYTGSLLPQIYPMRFSLREGAYPPPTNKKGYHPPGDEDRLPHCLAMGPSEGGAPTGPPSNHWAKLMRPDSGNHLAACLLGLVRSHQHEPRVPISLFL